MKARDVRLTIRGEDDPQILKWSNSLKYGAFPKVLIEILRWYEKNGLLVKGGVNQPDILPPQIRLNQVSLESVKLDEALKLLKENNQLLQSGTYVHPVAEVKHTHDVSDSQAELASTSDNEPAPTPFASPFKVYKNTSENS